MPHISRIRPLNFQKKVINMKLFRAAICALSSLLLLPALCSAQQTVLLDFDSGTDGTINYTTQMRDDVQSLMETIYQDFDFTFTQSAPTTGPFTTITYNSAAAGGLADGIDFRNLNMSDNAVVNVDGLGFTATDDIVGLSANIGSHELGHLVGLRHRDGFGPIGSGVFPGLGGAFFPAFPGPSNASEFENHVLSTPAFGADINRFTQPVWLSERSAIKLAFAEDSTTVAEVGANDTLATAQSLIFGNLVVPNTIIVGQNAGIGDFDVDAVSVEGSLTAGDNDFFEFTAAAGDLFNFEVMSAALDRLDDVDTQISIFDSNGAFVDYFGQDAFNDDEIETLDSVIIDLVIPDDGTYFIQVNGFAAADTGDYELFVSRFNGATAVPEPGCVAILLGACTLIATRRRRLA